MSVTYTSANKIMDLNFGGTSYVVPSTLYMGLSTTSIGIDGTGATEPSGNGYARVAVTNNKTNFGTASNGVITNLTAITFPESTASWGTITHIFFSDASSGGNIWYYEQLTTARTVQANTTILFAVSALSLTMNNS